MKTSQGGFRVIQIVQRDSLKAPKGQSVVFQGLLRDFPKAAPRAKSIKFKSHIATGEFWKYEGLWKNFGTVSENCSFGIIFSHSECPMGQSEGSLGTVCGCPWDFPWAAPRAIHWAFGSWDGPQGSPWKIAHSRPWKTTDCPLGAFRLSIGTVWMTLNPP